VFSIHQNEELAAVPSSVGVCPDCCAPILVEPYEFTQIIPGVNLYKPDELFGLQCSAGHFRDPDSVADKDDEWLRLYDLVGEWLIHAPLFFEL
jgi:hypothetical protein